jgi:lysophospholipase L1-like esterase
MTIAPSPNGNILYVALGDSITYGYTSDPPNGQNGFRSYLQADLVGPGEIHNLTPCGSQVSGTAGLHHEGYPGYTIGQLITLVQGGLLANPGPAFAGPPQLVILGAGANDAGQGRTWQQMRDDSATLLQLLLALPSAPAVVWWEQILMSGSISHTLTDNSRKQQAFNQAMPQVIAELGVAGRVSIAQTSRIPQGHLDGSGVHPTDLGYREMEWEIYQALAAFLGTDLGDGVPVLANRPCPYPLRPGV